MPANNRSRDDDDFDDDRPRRRKREDDEDDDRPRKRKRDEDDDYDHDHPRGRAPESNGLATAGLILGILSFCGGVAGIPAVICSLLALGKPTGRGLAITGLLLGGLGMLVWAGIAVVLFTGGWEAMQFAGG